MENRRQIIEKFVAENYLKKSAPDMAAHFNCSATTIKAIRSNLGLKVPLALSKKWTGEKNATKTTCSIEDDQYIVDNYLLKGSKKMARELNFSTTKVLTRMRQLGLVVPEEVKRLRSLDNRFKAGSVPVTKGKKQTDYMTAEAIEKTKASRFKRGSKPKNTLPSGTITIRTNYKDGTQKKWISLGINVWVPLHIHIWEDAHGKVPAKHCVRFKDGNPLNCELDNLALVSKKDSYRLNSLAGKGLSADPRIKTPNKRRSQAVSERKKQ
ncbi:HNH endonuclease [Pedobacter terrae]|uniref:HNH endonuclease n=2 Tax=Pedobacter terrae TaxID=405671 RepID=A0A1G7W8J0_9SPHI|nr:HNH endonuclease [Pedobacter terrae]